MQRFYVYRWIGDNCGEAKLLGLFETDKPLHKVWDLMFQVFCEDNKGMFVRRSLI